MLLPPHHVSSGCFQASPLYSPYPVLCLCACSVAVTSLAVSRLQVAFWGNPSHKAGARGAVLVSIHGRLEGWPAGQVCFLHHGLTPGRCSGTDGVPSRHVDPTISPASPGGEGNRVPAVSVHPYLCHSEARTSLPAQHCHKDCRCWLHRAAEPAQAPEFLPWPQEWGGFCFPPWPSPLPWASGKWQHMALPRCQPGCWRRVLCSSWTVTQPGNQHRGAGGGKAFVALTTEAEVLCFLFLTKQLLLG